MENEIHKQDKEFELVGDSLKACTSRPGRRSERLLVGTSERWFTSSRRVGSVYGRVYGRVRGLSGWSGLNGARGVLGLDRAKDGVLRALMLSEDRVRREYDFETGTYRLAGEIVVNVADVSGDDVLNEVDALTEHVEEVVDRLMLGVAFRSRVSYGVRYEGETIVLTPELDGYDLL